MRRKGLGVPLLDDELQQTHGRGQLGHRPVRYVEHVRKLLPYPGRACVVEEGVETAAADDGLPPGEGAFLACSFWLVDAYVLQHRWRDARELFERLLALRNDVGLLSEEYDPRTRRLVGNFPQAFTHVALVNSAFNLTRFEKPVEQRARPASEDLSLAAEA